MANIFDYLIWRGDLPLSVSPFNEVDGAVFARLSYLPFELIMPCDSPVSVTIADAAAALISLNIKKPGSLRKENDAKLLEMLLNSRRFRDIELFGYSCRNANSVCRRHIPSEQAQAGWFVSRNRQHACRLEGGFQHVFCLSRSCPKQCR